ncbi:hypothetical protein OC844_005345 [Tilletia horrida]|nr:hypothetical protein OC844_005345 [Tilletia horrida]
MKPTSPLRLWALVALVLHAHPALCSLLNPQSPVFAQLADLTRPETDQLASGVSAADQVSGGPPDPAGFGMQWVTEATPVVRLLDGTLNQGAFAIRPTGADGKTFDKGAPEHQELVKQSLAAISDEKSRSRKGSGGVLAAADSLDSKATGAEQGGGSGGGSAFLPLNPSSIPLFVRSPYLNAWLPSGSLDSARPPNKEGNGGYLAGSYPTFWTSGRSDGDFRLGIHGYLRINGQAYQFMGDGFGNLVPAGPNAKQISMQYTSTRTIFKFDAGGVRFTLTFLTPITPNDYLRQSIPASYVHFELDDPSQAKSKQIQLFMDVDERWATGHDHTFDEQPYRLDIFRKAGTTQYAVTRKEPEAFTEYRDRAEWGSFVFAAEHKAGLSMMNENNRKVQQQFLDHGLLNNQYREVLGPDNSFAYSVDFTEKDAGSDIVFALGHFRTPYANYVRPSHPGTNSTESYQQELVGFWTTRFANFTDAIAFFLEDYGNALANSLAFDQKVENDSKNAAGGGSVGDHYAAITSLSIRQALSALEITVPKGSKDPSSIMLLMKEIESSGIAQTVDVIYPLHVLLTYLNPQLVPLVLKPILEYASSGLYPNKWCPHDLGQYPNLTGYPKGDDLAMQVEESGNMPLMLLHWARLVGADEARPFLRQHYGILTQWSQFLISDALIPATQLSTDDFAGTAPNQTSLALKGILGIGAMSRIADIVGQKQDAAIFRNVSQSYIPVWMHLATASSGDHLKLVYGDDNSWLTLYNLLMDRIDNLSLVPKSIYNLQDAYYPQVRKEYGVPLDSRFNWAKTDWQMFSAANALTDKVRDMFIEDLYKFASDRLTDVPFPDLIETTSGDMPKPPFDFAIQFFARPVVGGHFALLAKAQADQANGITDSSQYRFAPEPAQTSFTDVQIIEVLHQGIALGRGLSGVAPRA